MKSKPNWVALLIVAVIAFVIAQNFGYSTVTQVSLPSSPLMEVTGPCGLNGQECVTTTYQSGTYTAAQGTPSGSNHVADFWQQWTDLDTGQVLLRGDTSSIQLALSGSTIQGSRVIVVDLKEKLVSPLSQGPMMGDPTLRLGCLVSLSPTPLCMFNVLQFTPTVGVLINDNLIQKTNPGILQSPVFVSFLDPAGSSRDVFVYLWLTGPSPSVPQNSVIVDLRSAVSGFTTSSFSLTVNAYEHWASYWLYYGFFTAFTDFGHALSSYLISQYQIAQIDVSNQAKATYYYNFTFSSGLSGIPTGTTTYIPPTASCGTSFGLPACTAPPATPTTSCSGPNCVASGGSGTTTTPGSGGYDPCNAFAPTSPLYAQCKAGGQGVVCQQVPWLCSFTLGIANWVIVLAIVALLVLYVAFRPRGASGGISVYSGG